MTNPAVLASLVCLLTLSACSNGSAQSQHELDPVQTGSGSTSAAPTTSAQEANITPPSSSTTTTTTTSSSLSLSASGIGVLSAGVPLTDLEEVLNRSVLLIDECGQRTRLLDVPVITVVVADGLIVRVDVTASDDPDAVTAPDPVLDAILSEIEFEGLSVGVMLQSTRPDLASLIVTVPGAADGLAGPERQVTVAITGDHATIVTVDEVGAVINLRWGRADNVQYLYSCA